MYIFQLVSNWREWYKYTMPIFQNFSYESFIIYIYKNLNICPVVLDFFRATDDVNKTSVYETSWN